MKSFDTKKVFLTCIILNLFIEQKWLYLTNIKLNPSINWIHALCWRKSVISLKSSLFFYQVNDISFREATLADAVRCLKETPSPVRLIILRENPQALFTTNESTCSGSRQDLILSRYYFSYICKAWLHEIWLKIPETVFIFQYTFMPFVLHLCTHFTVKLLTKTASCSKFSQITVSWLF